MGFGRCCLASRLRASASGSCGGQELTGPGSHAGPPASPLRPGQMLTWLLRQALPASVCPAPPLLCGRSVPLAGLRQLPGRAGFRPLMLAVGFQQCALATPARLGTKDLFFPREGGNAPAPRSLAHLFFPCSLPGQMLPYPPSKRKGGQKLLLGLSTALTAALGQKTEEPGPLLTWWDRGVSSPHRAKIIHHRTPAGTRLPIPEEPRDTGSADALGSCGKKNQKTKTPNLAPPAPLSKASPRSPCGRTACKAGVCKTLARATCIFNCQPTEVPAIPIAGA